MARKQFRLYFNSAEDQRLLDLSLGREEVLVTSEIIASLYGQLILTGEGVEGKAKQHLESRIEKEKRRLQGAITDVQVLGGEQFLTEIGQELEKRAKALLSPSDEAEDQIAIVNRTGQATGIFHALNAVTRFGDLPLATGQQELIETFLRTQGIAIAERKKT